MNRELLNTEGGIDRVPEAEKSDSEICQEVLNEPRLQLTKATFNTWVRWSTAQRVDGRWEITCSNALAQNWIGHRLGKMIRRELEGVGEIQFRAR